MRQTLFALHGGVARVGYITHTHRVYSELRRVVKPYVPYGCKQREKGDAAALVARPPCQRGPGPHPGSLTGNGKYKAHRLVIQKGVDKCTAVQGPARVESGATKKSAFPELFPPLSEMALFWDRNQVRRRQGEISVSHG